MEKRKGRPTLTPGKPLDVFLRIRTTADELEHIKAAAAQANSTTSAWIRKTLAKATQHVR